MKNNLIFFFILFAFQGFSQTDILQLKTGEEKSVVFLLEQIPSKQDTLKYKLINTEKILSIPMTNVHKLTLSDGYVLYEDTEPLVTEEKLVQKAPKTERANIISDKIIFKNGNVLEVLLQIEEVPTFDGDLKYKKSSDAVTEIVSMSEVDKLILSDGYILYEFKNEIVVAKKEVEKNSFEDPKTLENEVEAPKQEEGKKIEPEIIRNDPMQLNNGGKDSILTQQVYVPPLPVIRCTKEVDELKREIDYRSVMLYNEILYEMEQSRKEYSNASYASTENFKNKLYLAIDDEIELLMCANAFVEAEIKIYVDTAGKAVEIIDEVTDVKQLRLYTELRENSIHPFIRNHTFTTTDTIFDYSIKIQDFFDSYEDKINNTNCPEEFNEVISIAKQRFMPIEKAIKSKHTIYTIPINYSFTSKYQVWIYQNGNIQIKGKGQNIRVQNDKIISQFEDNLGKKKNGEYNVTTCFYKILDDSLRMSLTYVNQKYIHYVHVGATIGSIVPIESSQYEYTFGQIIPVEGMLIFHRFGLFGGTGLTITTPYKNVDLDGTYLEDPEYYFGGIYIGLAQYFYWKAGYSYARGELVEYKNSIELNREDFSRTHGFLTGFSLIFPVLHLEGGYNYNFNKPYVSAGLNIPLNK